MLHNPMETHFTADCRALMRHEITEATGNEVFFIGRCNVDGIVYEAEAIARANLYAALSTLAVGTQKSFVGRERFEEKWAEKNNLATDEHG